MYSIISYASRDIITSSFTVWILFISFSCLITVVLRVNFFEFSPLRIALVEVEKNEGNSTAEAVGTWK